MTGYAELVLRLTAVATDRYRVETDFTAPDAAAPVQPDPGEAVFDFEGLMGALDDTEAYAQLLTSNVFADTRVHSNFMQAVTAADLAHATLRIRILADASDSDIQNQRWELLRHPESGVPLAFGERYLFSRYLRSGDFRQIERHSRSELRALVMVANPQDLAKYKPEGAPLQPVNVQEELSRAIECLGSIPVTPVAEGKASLDELRERLGEGYDVLYLVCHGALVRDRPILYLERDDGLTAPVSGAELGELVDALRTPPTLCVLIACQSAGSGSRGALSAVGPNLARKGVPAVLAMQGKVTVETSRTFMSRFFKELAIDGQVDRAVAVARSDVKSRADAWMPVLFTRLKTGCIWSAAPVSLGLSNMPALLSRIAQGRCTPILGPGLIEFLLGSQREVAQRWANTYRFPMAPSEREDLPQVSQYLAVAMRDTDFPHVELEQYLEREMRERYGSQLPATLASAPLDALVAEIGRQRRARDAQEPYRILANLPLPLYITTNPDSLIAEALSEAGRQPEVALCRWKEDADWPESVYDREPNYLPSPQRPLVFHLFGRLTERSTIVQTEDDYFDYLIGVTKNDKLIPPPVVRAWSDYALLFLGFQVDDWNFRILFRSIMSQEGNRNKRPHVAVQIDPEEGRSVEPSLAREYLEQYFGQDDISIFWGRADEFLKLLWQAWQQRQH